MSKNKSVLIQMDRSWGDAAIDGLWPGLVGGILMIVYLLITGVFTGSGPLTIFGYFLPDSSLPKVMGLGAHLAVSAVYGTILGVLRTIIGERLPQYLPFWVLGIVFALLVWCTARLVIIPSGVSGLGQIPDTHFFLAHVIFGAGTGWILARNHSQVLK